MLKLYTAPIYNCLILGCLIGFTGCKSQTGNTDTTKDSVSITQPSEAPNKAKIDTDTDRDDSIPVAADFEDEAADEISPENTDETLSAIEAELDSL